MTCIYVRIVGGNMHLLKLSPFRRISIINYCCCLCNF